MKILGKRFLLISLLISFVAFFFIVAERSCGTEENENTRRINTVAVLMPSVEEMLCFVGGKNNIVAISDHCVYPEDIRDLPSVAGFKGIDFEELSRISPDAVFSNNVYDVDKEKIEKLGIKYYSFDDRSIDQIAESMKRMKELIDIPEGKKDEPGDFIRLFSRQPLSTKEDAIVVVGSSDGLKNIYIAGKGNIFSEIIERTGLKNAYTGSIEYPSVGAEDLMRMDPDNIFILDERKAVDADEKKRIINEWNKLDLKAVKEKNIYILNGDYVFIPGPRIIMLFDQIRKKKSEDS